MFSMSSYFIYIVLALVAAALLIFFIMKKDKGGDEFIDLGIDLNQLMHYLGGKENVIRVSSSLSKVSFVLKDYTIVDAKGIKELGATGIVANNNGLNAIFGKISSQIENEINKLL